MESTFSNCGTFTAAAACARSTDKGCSGSREPASAPTRIAAPASSSTTPTPFQKRCQPLACGGSGSMACRKIAENSSSAAQPSIIASAGITGVIIHSATASSMTPKAFLTPSIHGPTLGSRLREATPTASSGAPMPRPIANSAQPPSTASPVCAM